MSQNFTTNKELVAATLALAEVQSAAAEGRSVSVHAQYDAWLKKVSQVTATANKSR